MSAWYNEIDPFAAAWLRNLIAAGHLPAGEVDERDIQDVAPADLAGFSQHHFFAGIGGWPLSIRLAGVPDDQPVWTGSCPCQPFSSASRGRTVAADLWPAWRALIDAARPRVVFGEQVAAAGAWFDGVCDDLEAMGYAVGAAILPAVTVGADHARARIYFAGHANGDGEPIVPVNGEVARMPWVVSEPEPVSAEDGLPGDVGALSAYGNAVVPALAAEFVAAWMEA